MASLEESGDLCREALHALMGTALVSQVEIGGRGVSLSSDRTEDELSLTAAWDGGGLHFRLRVRSSSIERSKAEDRGHSLGLQAFADRGQRELNWISFEWAIRDSIRDEADAVPLLAANSYRSRKGDAEEGPDNQHMGPASRAMAERSGLGGSPSVTLGSWSLDEREWLPSPEAVLEALCKLVIIKAHFVDRGTGVTVEGAPLFSWSAVEGQAQTQTPRADRLGGVRRMAGTLPEHWDNLLEILELAQGSHPTVEGLDEWIEERHAVSGKRARSLRRLLVHAGLVQPRAGRLELGDGGALLIERREPWLLFDALRSAYTGFEESLEYIVRHPGVRSSALRAYLNAVLASHWGVDGQARVRAEWLAACGLVTVDGGRFFPTGKGTEIAETLELHLAPVAAEEETEEEVAYTDADQVQLSPAQVHVDDLVLPAGILERCCAALAAGKHLLLIGPPGTGKSTLAERLAAAATEAGLCEDALMATASADWTTYDTIGGWTQRSDGSLAFREGVVTRALRERRWLVLDEVNRADIDKSFGELFTALAGGRVTTPYTRRVGDEEVPVEIGPDVKPYWLGPWFRLIATMNIRDKASLFRLSYAFLRRFAVVMVPALDEADLAHLGERVAVELGLSASVRNLALRALSPQVGLGQFAPLGPSLLLDVLRYAKARGGSPDRAVAEGVGMVVLPQLEGLVDSQAKAAHELLGTLFSGEPGVLSELRAQLRSNFPHVVDFGS